MFTLDIDYTRVGRESQAQVRPTGPPTTSNRFSGAIQSLHRGTDRLCLRAYMRAGGPWALNIEIRLEKWVMISGDDEFVVVAYASRETLGDEMRTLSRNMSALIERYGSNI